MKAEHIYADYLEDILDSMKKIAQFIAGLSYDRFAVDDKTAFAVVRALEIIGEATKHIPERVRQRYPEVPWRGCATS